MNPLIAAMAVANPVITALLTIIIFLEKDKFRKRSEELEAALRQGNQELVKTIGAQKQDFINIADRLESLSKDSEKSAATFIGLSTALTESSTVSAKALGGVTEGLQNHAVSVSNLVTKLSNHVSNVSANAISELAIKSAESLKLVGDEVKKVEQAQVAATEAATDSIGKLVAGITQTSKSIKELQETLKSTVTL